ncbi:AimR family lysis-lysogeny pheromone receptor [Thalassobacillus devorans]|uniref:AimR family lysis-lysogeny pheromone receptor n=1 Tax=Thalassobacillus devorans TaxID=279813 RepID=UPI00048C2023|nr:AimR family lysis-lysogeny pheromone receptor [Thalassobacillus devorans]
MEDYQVIEPSRIDRLKMTVPSSIYSTYHHLLKKHSRHGAADLTKNYCLNAHFPREEQAIALEFLYMNGFFEEVQELLGRGEIEAPYDWFYRLLVRRKFGRPMSRQEVRRLKNWSQDQAAAETLRLFMLIYHHYDSKHFGSMDNYIDDIYMAMHHINKPLVKYYFQLRFDELMFQYHWKSNMGVVAKKYAYRVINSTLSPEKQSGMYHHLALVEVFDDYSAAMDHLTTSIQIAEENPLTSSLYELKERSLPFIAAFHRKTEGVKTIDPVETAHLAIAEGRMEKAEKILSSLPSLTPFQETYLGVARNDRFLLQKAYQRFKHEYGDHFFARLPFYYLKYID